MQITAGDATESDLSRLVHLYSAFAAEQAALRPLWNESEGLPDPVEAAIAELIAAGEVTVGAIDEAVVGFLVAEERTLVDGEERVGMIRYLYTDPEARGVGVADEMFGHGVAKLKAEGIEAFDAVVSPGHRQAKNFYEAHGFSARRITMHAHDPVVD